MKKASVGVYAMTLAWLEDPILKFSTTLQFIYCWGKECASLKFCEEELQMSKGQTIGICPY